MKNFKKGKNIIVLLEKYVKKREKMGEYVDLYNENKELTGEKIFRKKGEKTETPKNKYTIVVLAFIINSRGQYLIQKTSARKKGVWAFPGGHVKSGQSSLEAIHEELLEEMGIDVALSEIKLFKTYKYENAFKDVYIINKDISMKDIKLEENEVEKVCYLSKKEIIDLIGKNEIRKTNLDAIDDIFY